MGALSQATFVLPEMADLTDEQQQIKQTVLAFCEQHRRDDSAAVFVLQGDAGAGKSAVLSAVFNALQEKVHDPKSELFQTQNYLLVNHNEMLKIYWEVAAQSPNLHKKDFQKPTPFINKMIKTQQKADFIFVDEAQLLLSQKDAFNHFKANNQLDELLKLTHVLILVADFNQVVKLKSYWSTEMLAQHLAGHLVQKAHLSGQLRMKDPKIAQWVDALVQGKVLPIPPSTPYELRVFKDGLPLFNWVKTHNEEKGLSRLLATSDFPFRVFSKTPWYVNAGKLHLPWDRFNMKDQPWASQPQTLYEVGSIYTIQGFDLNYAGVILGPGLTYDAKQDRLRLHPEKFEDQTAFQNRHANDLSDVNAAHLQVMKNVLNILLKRGRYGLGLYACDPALNQHLLHLTQQS